MNIYPGQGFGGAVSFASIVLAGNYEEATPFGLCKIFGTLLTIEGEPVGSAGFDMSTDVDAGVTLIPTWNGIKVTANISVADGISGKIISVDKVTTTTNEFGYFEFNVLQGLNVSVACNSFGKTVTVTSGSSPIDLSGSF